MALTFTSTMTGANADYALYLWQDGAKLTKTDSKNEPVLLDFALVPWDDSFVKLTRGAYINLSTISRPNWFTGFVTNSPDLTYLGSKNGSPVWGYVYRATSDEYILSLNPLGIVPTFFNLSWGEILKRLAERSAPGVFDVTNIQNGPLVAQYTPDPRKKFGDVAKEGCESASYVFYGNDKKLYFMPQDDASLTPVVVDGNNTNFTPSQLSIKASSRPIINDCTVLGGLEPQAYVHEYFVGTGEDASFPLISSVFGADSSVLIDESFGSSIDGSKWVAFDTVARYLQVSNGYLNSLGGTATNTYNVRLQSASPLPLDGRLRFTHGEWDFLPGSGAGVIASCWTTAPSSGLSGCLYGLRFSSNTLQPIVQGTIDSDQSVTISTSKRYVIRTLVEFTRSHRRTQSYGFRSKLGVVGTFGGGGVIDTSTWNTLITEIDPANGSITRQWTFTNTATLSSSDLHAVYIPLASDNLHATVTGITVSTPINATLEWSRTVDFKNWNFETWSDINTPANWDEAAGVEQDVDFAYSGSACEMIPSAEVGTPYVSQLANGLIVAGTPYNVALKLMKTGLMSSGDLTVSFTGTGISGASFTVPVSSILSSGYKVFSGVLTTGFPSVPEDLALRIELTGGVTGQSVWIEDVVVSTGYQSRIVGPNEIDAADGLAPVATITQSNTGSETKSSLLGTAQYNPGQAQLVFFKNSLTLESNIPALNDLIRLSYRSAGSAIGRVVDRASVNSESATWLDNGYRSVVRTDLAPKPRNAAECEAAAAVVVKENGYQHYEGEYTQWSNYLSDEPRAGALFKFQNLSVADFQVEEITGVVTTLESITPVERFLHRISFGAPDHLQRFLSRVTDPVGAFQRNADAPEPTEIDINAVGTVYAPDVTKPSLVTWDDSYLYMDTGQDLASNGLWFEVRSTDDGWGVDDGKNLIARTSSRTFQVPRNVRGRLFFIRQAIAGNLCRWSEDQTQASVYSGVSCVKRTDKNPDGDIAQICTASFSGPGTFSAGVPVSGSTQYCWTFSARGPAGKTITATVGAASQVFTLSGYWQRFSLPFTQGGEATVSCIITAGEAMSLDLTRYSVEGGTSVERLYSKTTGNVYGPVSRYSAAVHVAFPVATEAATDGDIVIHVTADTTLLPGNYTVKVDTTAGLVTITMAPYVNMSGLHATIIKVAGANDVVIDTQGADTIRGEATYTLVNVGQSVTING
jgi:hypothetical protein